MNHLILSLARVTAFTLAGMLLFSTSSFSQNLTVISSGQTGTSGTNWAISGNTLTVSGGAASIQASVINNHLQSTGSLTVVATGNITVDQDIAVTLPALRTFTLKANGDILINASRSITANGASLNILLWSDADNSNGGMIFCKNGSSIASNGGHVWMGGGSVNSTWNGLTVGNGSAKAKTFIAAADIMQITTQSQHYQNGITLENFALTTNGGHFHAQGQSSGENTGYGHIGVFIQRGCRLLTGAGNIHISGTNASSRNATGWYWGVLLASDRTAEPNVIETTSGTIVINGTAGNSFSFVHSGGIGIFEWAYLGGNGSNRIKSISGNISISGTNNHATNNSYGGIVFVSQANAKEIITQSGNITLMGLSQNASVNGLAIGGEVKIGSDGVTPCTGTISLIGNRIQALNANSRIQSSGTLTIYPIDHATSIGIGGAAGTLALPASYFSTNFVDGFNNIRIGAAAQTGEIVLKDVAFNDNITLHTTGAVTQGGAITASGQHLTLLNGDFTLTHSGNAFAQLSANAGSVTYRNNTALTVNTTDAVNNIDIATTSGDLTIAGNIVSNSTSTEAITLGAGINSSAGNPSGGNIILAGTPSFTTGTGGRVRLYTGSFSPADGLYTHVGSNLDRVRFTTDVSTASFSPALGSGTHILYRESIAIWRGSTNSYATGSNWRENTVPLSGISIIIDPAATANLQLDAARTVGHVYFNNSNRKIVLGNFDYTVNGSPFNTNANNYFQTTGSGRLQRNLSHLASVVFPVGNSSYNPVSITNNTGSADIISVSVADEVYANGIDGSALSGSRVRRTWDIHKTNPNAGSGLDFTFNWNSGDLSSPIGTAALFHFDGGWQKQTGSTSVSGNSLTYTGYTGTFSPFAVATENITLPVSWLSFTGTSQQQQVLLRWSTASEWNTLDYRVQHSNNGSDWTEIGHLPGSGNSNTVTDYRFIHMQPVTGVNHYRLLQRDVDGNISYSKIIVVSFNSGRIPLLQLYPNPAASGIVNLQLSAPASVQIYNSAGSLVWQQPLNAGSHIIPTNRFSKGLYHVKAGNEKQILLVK